MSRILVSEPALGDRELELVADCLQTGEISSAGGTYLELFERRWAAYCGRASGVAVCNGTAALQLAVDCLDLEPGAEVILPTFTIVSCVLAVIYSGAVPVLVDSDARTGCMDVEQLEARITPRTRAIMPVHIYGHPVDMDAVMTLAHQRGLHVIEDSAEAHGAEYLTGRETEMAQWKRCGSFGALSAFSFYANKPITTGEGGMVLTDDPALADRLRSRRNLAFRPERRFVHEELGHNFRMTNLQAAIGVAQLERIDRILEQKRAIAAAYNEGLAGLRSLRLPVEEAWARSIYWMYAVVLEDDAGIDAADLATRLERQGIETRPFFMGMHEQPALLRRGLFHGERYPVAERIARRGLYLPSGTALTDAEIERVCAAVRAVLA